MGLTFYPIEDDAILEQFRQRLCPFMKAIQETTKSGYMNDDEIESIFDKIIHAARSNEITNQLSAQWYQFIRNPLNRTLDREHDNLVATDIE